MVNFQTMFLLKMTILSLHQAQAPNGQFPNNVLIENDHSEPPRGATSEWSIFKQCSNNVSVFQMVDFESHFGQVKGGSLPGTHNFGGGGIGSLFGENQKWCSKHTR